VVAVKTHKRRPVAPTKDTQVVNLNTLTALRPESTVEAYHVLFMNVELLMGTMMDHGAEDEVITMINSARVAQRCREVTELHKFLDEIISSAKRWEDETNRVAKRAEEDRYSPESTVARLRSGDNPRRLTPPDTGAAVNLTITARLSHSLPQSSAELLRAEQVYGPFWTIRSRCFVVPRGINPHTAFLAYKNANPKFAKKDYRLLTEYRLVQNTYRNVEIYMLVTLPRLFALRDTKVLELGMSTREQMRAADLETRLPIIERAELAVSRLPKIVSADSKRYMVARLVEYMLLDEKRGKLRKARYARDGEPPRYTAASSLLSAQRFAISSRLAERIGVIPQEIHKAITNKAFSSYIGAFLRAGGRSAWEEACALVREWHKLKKMAEV
jgi:hypothetical protein